MVHFKLGWYQARRRGLNTKLPGTKKPNNLTEEMESWNTCIFGFVETAFCSKWFSAVEKCGIFCSRETHCRERGDLGKLK